LHAEARSLSIAAASILIKTTRDAFMIELDPLHPSYRFARHKGYPVHEHFAALDRLGACPAHRRSLGPVRAALGLPPIHPEPAPADAETA
jgi:ribonuclease HII